MRSGLAYKTRHSIFMYGDDFSHSQADSSYLGMEDIIACMAVLYPNVAIKFSTLKQYLAAVNSSQQAMPDFNTDFVPYQADDESFWSGYYTSNPSFKRRINLFSNSIRAILTLSSLYTSSSEITNQLRKLQRA